MHEQNLYQENPMTKFFNRFAKDESGATAIEYGLIAALIAVVLVAVMGQLDTGLRSAFGTISGHLSGGAGGGE
jgi:pilus assembly protein Flp/PilA